MSNKQKPLLYAHIGDLHITNPREQNYKDFLSIVAQIAVEFGDQLDFVLLPGDNADNGLPAQYKLIAAALKMLDIPVYIITGDHDMEQGDLSNFYHYLPTRRLPFKEKIKGVDCVFLDFCGAGSGGPDFRLGTDQLDSLTTLFELSKNEENICAIFMHSYPVDLKNKQETKQLLDLINSNQVALVDMGHTHYNELASNGRTVYGATRSTGQIEEGPAGYAIVGIDNGAVSWRFKALDDPFPFVQITTPSDFRICDTSRISRESGVEIRATIFSNTPVKTVVCIADDEHRLKMDYDAERNDWYTWIPYTSQQRIKVCVEAVTIEGRPGRHNLEIATPFYSRQQQGIDGSDDLSIGGWPENGILGTQLGPNRNAKPTTKK